MSRADVAILGGGPAGATAGILLARAGLRVALVTSGASAGHVEGASPRLFALLSRLGLPVEGIGPAVRRHVEWGSMPASPNAEHPLDRARFDAGLLAQAAAEGVTVLRARIQRCDTACGRIDLADGRSIAAGRLIEARGRRAPGSAERRGPPALAIIARTPADIRTTSTVAARPAGWVWRIPSPVGGSLTQIVTDRVAPGRAGIAEAWARLVPDHPLPPGARTRSAEMRLVAHDLDPACPRLGDAAIAMDPLSGHGLFWAISSALMVPPLIAALDAGRTDLARRFWRERIAATFWRQARIGRDFYRLAGLDAPFWEARTGWPDDRPAHPAAATPFRRRQVVVEAGRLTESEAVVTAMDPDGVAFLAGRPLAPLLDALGPAPLPGPDALAPHLPGRSPAQVRAAHDWLAARGLPGPRATRSRPWLQEATP